MLSIAGTHPARGSASSTSDLRPKRYIIALHSLAGMAVVNATYTSTLRHFHPLAADWSSSFTRGGCMLMSRELGFEAQFESFYPSPSNAASCSFFARAVVSSGRWATSNGLRVGSSAAALRRLFPRAFDTQEVLPPSGVVPRGCIDWWLAKATRIGTYPILAACVKAGKVAAMSIEIAGH